MKKHKDLKMSYGFAARFTPPEHKMLVALERLTKLAKNTLIRTAVRRLYAAETRKAKAHQGK